MTKKLYVGNLSYQMTEDGLRTSFPPWERWFGEDHYRCRDGAVKGFGFVEMASDEDADKAIAEPERDQRHGPSPSM